MTTTSTPQHVLIVGGGMAGPCLALCLARRNIRSTLFEIRPGWADAGGSFSLGPSALRVLDVYAGIYDLVRDVGYTYNRFGVYDEKGNKFGEIAVGEEKGEHPYPALRIMRSIVHKTMLDTAEAMNGMCTVKWGVRLTKIEEDDGGVTVHFENGCTARGDILIGADGVHSKVREHILGPDAPAPHYDGFSIVNGFLPVTAAITPPSFTFPAFMFTPSGQFMTIPIDRDGQTVAWNINTTMQDLAKREDWREFEQSGEAARRAKANYADMQVQPVRSLLDAADDSQARMWVPYSIPDVRTWHTMRVCLIGDAAHALPPNGLGAAVAFEDAAILTRLLTAASTKSYAALFAEFERVRRPRVDVLRKAEKSSSDPFKDKSGPVVWFLKKIAFRAYFWWSGGVIEYNKETSYDVSAIEVDA